MFTAVLVVTNRITCKIHLLRQGCSFLRITRGLKVQLRMIQIGAEHNCSYCSRCCSSHCHCCSHWRNWNSTRHYKLPPFYFFCNFSAIFLRALLSLCRQPFKRCSSRSKTSNNLSKLLRFCGNSLEI